MRRDISVKRPGFIHRRRPNPSLSSSYSSAWRLYITPYVPRLRIHALHHNVLFFISLLRRNRSNRMYYASTTLNPRRYKQRHSPPPHRGKRDGEIDLTSPGFSLCYNTSNVSHLLESLWCTLQAEVYLISCDAAEYLWDHPIWPPSWILPKIFNFPKTKKKRRKEEIIWNVT